MIVLRNKFTFFNPDNARPICHWNSESEEDRCQAHGGQQGSQAELKPLAHSGILAVRATKNPREAGQVPHAGQVNPRRGSGTIIIARYIGASTAVLFLGRAFIARVGAGATG